MRPRWNSLLPRLLAVLCLAAPALAGAPTSAYSGHPRLVVIIVIDQFRGDYLSRYRTDFVQGGFNLFLEHGAVFTNCNYDYASTRTAPGHATLLTGAYADKHGILSNDYWDPEQALMKDAKGDSCGKVPFVWDKDKKLVWLSASSKQPPENVALRAALPRTTLQAATLGDELEDRQPKAARASTPSASRSVQPCFPEASPRTERFGPTKPPEPGPLRLITIRIATRLLPGFRHLTTAGATAPAQ